jgi:hypothetical protein
MFVRTIVLLAASIPAAVALAAEPAPTPECADCMRSYLEGVSACALAPAMEADTDSCADSAGRDFGDCANAVCPQGAPVKYNDRDHWSFVVGGEERCGVFSASFTNPQDGRSYLAGWVNGSSPGGSEPDDASVEQVAVRMNDQEDDDAPSAGAFHSGAGGWIRPLKGGVNTVTLNLCRREDSPVGLFTLMFSERTAP